MCVGWAEAVLGYYKSYEDLSQSLFAPLIVGLLQKQFFLRRLG